ncbi:hypothetical protein [Halioxenophilus aromaticivorans]|uniref:PNPLA domain-containing protein n=1 Tax=Halioxenophilus aromaticivorans TaxID=1306992 RepID=A0AAV3TZT7_9ALTE
MRQGTTKPALNSALDSRQAEDNTPRLQQWAAAVVATGFTACVVTLGALLITSVGQIQDILVQVDQSTHLLHRIGLVLAGCWFSMICWWSARFVFEAMAKAQPGNQSQLVTKSVVIVLPAAPGISSTITRYLPRCYAAILPLVIAVQSARNGLWQVFTINLLAVLIPVMALVIYRRKLTQWLEARYFLSSRRDWHHEIINPYFWGWCAMVLYGAVAVWALANPYTIGHALGAFFVVYWGLGSILFQLVVAICVVLPAALALGKKLLTHLWPEQATRLQRWSQHRWLAPPYPVLLVVALCAGGSAVFFDTDNHHVRRMDSSTGYAYADFDAAWQHFTRNLIQQGLPAAGSEDRVYPVFFVASQGGGLRAAYWASQGLAALTSEIPGISNNLFSLAGVSGGSVGNAFFAAALAGQTQPANSHCDPQTERLPCLLGLAVGQDYLSPVLTSFLYNDMLYRFFPVAGWPFLARDRAAVLETSWENGFAQIFGGNQLSQPMQQIYRQQTRWLPLLLSMGAHQETGARLITAPFDIDPTIFVDHYNTYRLMGCHSDAGLQCDVRASTAALNSARFPYVTPAGTLATSTPWHQKDHIIDGGYVENFGLMATQQMIHYLHRTQKLVLQKDGNTITLMPVILVFSNDMDTMPALLNHRRTVPYVNTGSFAFNELTNPIQGLIANRTARSVQSLTQAIAWQQHYSEQQYFAEFSYPQPDDQEHSLLRDFIVLQLQPDRDGDVDTLVPLGWWLSENSQSFMAKKLREPDYRPYQLIQQIKQHLVPMEEG